MMSSDLETPPDKVRDIIARAKVGDVDIVATSRWVKGGGFSGYHPVKYLCSWIFQKLYALLYWTALTDMSYGYCAHRTALFARYGWRETGHAFFMESICRFLRTRVPIAEVRCIGSSGRKGKTILRRANLYVIFAPDSVCAMQINAVSTARKDLE